MLVKLLIIGGLFAVLISLGVALMRLIRGGERSDATVRALTLPVALSIGLFVLDDRVRHRMADPRTVL